MKDYLKQAIYILICSILLGTVFNTIRPNGIPLLRKTMNGVNTTLNDDEFIIEPIDLKIAQKLFYDSVPFVDARDAESYMEGHILGAISNDPFYSMVDKLFDTQGFDNPIVVYCDDEECGLSEYLAYQLQTEGFHKIYIFSGGWNQWVQANLPIEK